MPIHALVKIEGSCQRKVHGHVTKALPLRAYVILDALCHPVAIFLEHDNAQLLRVPVCYVLRSSHFASPKRAAAAAREIALRSSGVVDDAQASALAQPARTLLVRT